MGSTRVLIVDDDPGSRELLSEVLSANGYSVSTAVDGSAACDELSRDGGYQIVIADLRMPNGSGLDVLRELRGRHQRQALILMSSFMTGTEKEQALELGARALLEKPFRLSHLLEVVGGIADGRQVGFKA